MNGSTVRILPAFLLLISVLTLSAPVRAQLTTVSNRPAITVLDSTKQQDGLVGSVRRVKTETARIEFKDGRPVEGPLQLVEVTTYGIKGNRIENTSYPIGGSVVGKEEYKYDQRGNITEMTVRDDRGAILTREAYNYEFDKFGNWTKMVTNLVVFENGELKREPVEVTYRTLTYYFDDSIAKIIREPKQNDELKVSTAPPVPQPAAVNFRGQEVLEIDSRPSSPAASAQLAAEPPPLLKRSEPEGVESAYAGRKRNEVVIENVGAPAASASPKVEPSAPASNVNNQKLANDLYLAGRNRFDIGDARGAIDSYLQSIKVDPDSAEVHLNLGHAYLTLEKDREAIKAFKESIRLNPAVAETHYGLGYSNFRIGRFREAADAFKKAIALEPKMAKAHFGLSLSYQELGNTSGLMDEYRILETLDRGLAKKLAQTFPQFNFSCRLVRGCP